MIKEVCNALYDEYSNKESTEEVYVTIITPVYNRRVLLQRALSSVMAQTCRCMELIVINDGSTEVLDDIMDVFMDNADFPVLYISKPNAGVHTARNIGIKRARGKFTVFLDSDDELVPTAIADFLNGWNEIPIESRNQYREVVAHCINEKGEQITHDWEIGIILLPKIKSDVLRKKNQGETTALFRTDTLKASPWPEPDGVTVIPESLVWNKLDRIYSRWYINKRLRIYYTETLDGLCKQNKKRNVQFCINHLFWHSYILNNASDYKLSAKSRIVEIIKFTIVRQHLKSVGILLPYKWSRKPLQQKIDNILASFVFIPVWIAYHLIAKSKFSN